MDILSLIVTQALANPTFIKELFYFAAAWFLLKKGVEKVFDKLTGSVDKLTKSLQEHIIQTDLRMQEGDARFDMQDKLIADIKVKMESFEQILKNFVSNINKSKED